MADSPTFDDIADDIYTTGSLEPLAELVSDPALATWLRKQQLGTAIDRHIRARASVVLMSVQMGELDKPAHLAAIQRVHYGGDVVDTQRRIVGLASGFDADVKQRGLAFANDEICTTPKRKARAISRLRKALSGVK